MFEVTVLENFCAAHYLRGYGGKCENMHGHNYRVEFTMRGGELDNIGMLVDFTIVRSILQAILDEWDHKVLNEMGLFTGINPTAENIAREVCIRMVEKLGLNETAYARCDVWETERSKAGYVWGKQDA